MTSRSEVCDRRLICLHIIGSLEIGGAEMTLCKLIESTDPKIIGHIVVSLLPPEALEKRIKAAGARIVSLNMSRNRITLTDICRLAKLIKKINPDLVHTWMYISDIIGGLATRLAGTFPIIFSIRHGSFKGDKARTVLLAKITAWLSHLIPQRIIACSTAAAELHRQTGYAADRVQIIPNGFTKKDNSSLRGKLRAHLGVNKSAILVGMIGRYVPAKDHNCFIKAATLVKKLFSQAEFVLCGAGVEKNNHSLASAIDSAGLANCCHLLGNQTEIDWILADLNFLVSSSSSEAFANVIGEAMASGIPCVATNVGDSAHIIGSTGIIVPPDDHQSLAQGMLQMLQKTSAELAEMGMQAQKRILQMFSLPAVARCYEKMYFEVANVRRSKR
ncbi:MAG: glycosyltransferase [Candidatus Riflebacteria bacterium]|nr:glycosyltransferase [Candidatus Riflebacteria bacterium]